ncbi:hypothetical protein SAMN05428936_10326 [Pelagibacterium halotolerans]|nr:hypothetical protein SAMN05428936_10326 [Pelagibacterium halotolerans]
MAKDGAFQFSVVIPVLSRDPVNGSPCRSFARAERTEPRRKAGVTKWGVRAMRCHFAHRRAP